MFNLFKKRKVESQNEVRANKYPAIVEKIHKEFHTAADTLLLEAKAVIAKAETKDKEKVLRLERTGFVRAGQVTKLKPLIKSAELSEAQVSVINDYSFRYPTNKFITPEQVNTICKKYNLVCGPVANYLGFVPEKNLREVERFSVLGADKQESYITNIKLSFSHQESLFDLILSKYPDGKIPMSVVREGTNANIDSPHGMVFLRSYDVIDQNGMMICAPQKDMETRGLTKKGFMLLKSKTVHVPDPVVLQPVKGGYLIVTAWGAEASDENVVNQKMN